MYEAIFQADAETPLRLARLSDEINAGIPLAGPMGVRVDGWGPEGLTLSMPLTANRNPHGTAFAGSLNALCVISGWAMCHAIVERIGLEGVAVLRRSSIKYHTPVDRERVRVVCLPPRAPDLAHFAEMLREKGLGKLDLVAQVALADAAAGVRPGRADDDRPAVLFAGSYVVQGEGSDGATLAAEAG